MLFLQLKVVIWKNIIIRKRHWFLTIVESLLPMLLFLLISYGRSKVTGLNKIEVSEVTYNSPLILQYGDLDVSETKLYFTPNTEFYQDLMKRVQVKFQMYNNNIKGFPSTESLLQYYASHHNNTIIAITFNEKDEKNLDYVMRIHHEFYATDISTDELYKSSFGFEPGAGSSYFHKGYLSIQKALDISFIEKVSGKDLEDNVTLIAQEFPYPPHKQDSALTTMFMTLLPIITLLSFIFISPAVLKRVVEEKHSGIKELLKMVGMKPWMIWLGWFIYGIIPMLFSILCIVLLMKLPWFGTEYPPIQYTDGSILFVFLLLYCMAAIVFCFAISSLFDKPSVAMVVGILVWILSYFVPKYGLGLEEMNTKISGCMNMALNMFPNMALHYGYLAISAYEERDRGVQWNNFYKSSSGGTEDITMLNVFVMLIVDMIVYMAFTLYMDGLNPGKYGVRKSFLFPIRPLCRWISGLRQVEVQKGGEPLNTIEGGKMRKKSSEIHGLVKGIQIQGLVKRFGHKTAVNDLDMDIYRNQITVLLGPNGAGKSTTMSIITGMLDMTSGCVKMNGLDIRNNMDEIRRSLGLCLQHNLLFTDLTVGEHLLFFAKLKGRTAEEANEEMLDLLGKLHLSDKKDVMACTLSGGMKRKLCLGMAIIGGSEVLILDEPTSGMDPESRRELWDLLLAWRREKTILITTHFMEEADALGDYIAIMANGSLQCYGTPMALKKAYDTGYHLSLMVKDEATPEERNNIKTEVSNKIGSAEFKDCNGNNMVFLLPLEDNSKIARLLTFLEINKTALKIENISVTVTTLEDIFMKVKTKSEESHRAPHPNSKAIATATRNTDSLFLMRGKALMVKKLKFYKKKIWSYLMPALIAVVFMVLTIYLSGNIVGDYGDNGPEIKLKLSSYKHSTAFYNGTEQSDVSDRLKTAYRSIVEANTGRAVDVKDVEQEIVKEGIENIVYYKTHLIASAEFNSNVDLQATALYSALAIHSAPISLNLITNALAKVYLGEDYSITASNWPLPTVTARTTREYSKDKVRLLWAVIMPIGFLLVIGSFIVLPHKELSTKFTQLQYMCGVKPYWYWLVNWFMDFILYLLISLVMAAVAVAMAPYLGASEFFHLLLIFIMYGAASIPFVYLFSRKKSISAGFAVFVIIGIFFGIVLTVSVQGLMEVQDDYYNKLGHTLKVVFIVALPQVGLAHSVMMLTGKAIDNYNWYVMPRLKQVSICMRESNPCCAGETEECKVSQGYCSLLVENMLLMLVSCLIYMIINMLADSYFVKKWYSKIEYEISKIRYGKDCLNYKSVNSSDSDCDSITDAHHNTLDGMILQKVDPYAERHTNTLNARNLQKVYSGKQVVKNIDFSLKQKECLGILGVNGAGKTTTFRMLTREEFVINGNVNVFDSENNRISIDQDQYLEQLGYCPQTDALNFELTGKDILTLIAQLRGVNDPNIVKNFLELFELEEYADIPCGYYSGGNKRKLSLAVALIGFPKLVLLDEPTNGVDPSSRRNFWNLIRTFKEKQDLSLILTSHSMVECEALCNNLKIMKAGKFAKEGTISELKREHGGFNIKLKLLNKDVPKDERAKEASSNNLCEVVNETSSIDSDEAYDEVDSLAVVHNDTNETSSDSKPAAVNDADETSDKIDSIPVTFSDVNELKEHFKNKYSGTVKDEHSSLLHIYVEDKNKKWSTMFNDLENIKAYNRHLIEDYAISEASLEDVFLTVARSKEKEDGEQDEGKKKSKKNKKVRTGNLTV